MLRRTFIALAAITLTGGIGPAAFGQAQSWPDKPVKVIVPFAPGGATDQTARVWAEKLSAAFGQQFIVENRGGGASGSIGIESVVKSPPDGYTLLYSPNASLAVVPQLRKVNFDPVKDLEPVGRTGDGVYGFTIHPSLGIKTFNEMIEYARKNPGKLVYGSSGIGMANHLRIEAVKNKFNVDILHVPYRGGADTLNDHLPGTVHMMNEPVSLPHVKAGKLILLNINGPVRHPEFPDVPSTTELGIPDAEVPVWFSIWAPAGTPKDIREKMNAKMAEIAATDDMKARMIAVNVIVPKQSPDEMRQYLIDDIRRNKEVIEKNNIKVE
ncbi:MAG TPA: tripartite tricarboxylate transporter substrate binding protein [Hyphomicrobiaceae bacterium]|nr:tripartite tricarboxylate transporter substrate binding protein [Hyphomicrobiaceae bacterium]